VKRQTDDKENEDEKNKSDDLWRAANDLVQLVMDFWSSAVQCSVCVVMTESVTGTEM
jgi:hypothetical protein